MAETGGGQALGVESGRFHQEAGHGAGPGGGEFPVAGEFFPGGGRHGQAVAMALDDDQRLLLAAQGFGDPEQEAPAFVLDFGAAGLEQDLVHKDHLGAAVEILQPDVLVRELLLQAGFDGLLGVVEEPDHPVLQLNDGVAFFDLKLHAGHLGGELKIFVFGGGVAVCEGRDLVAACRGRLLQGGQLPFRLPAPLGLGLQALACLGRAAPLVLELAIQLGVLGVGHAGRQQHRRHHQKTPPGVPYTSQIRSFP